jgi:hypothetical protein
MLIRLSLYSVQFASIRIGVEYDEKFREMETRYEMLLEQQRFRFEEQQRVINENCTL